MAVNHRIFCFWTTCIAHIVILLTVLNLSNCLNIRFSNSCAIVTLKVIPKYLPYQDNNESNRLTHQFLTYTSSKLGLGEVYLKNRNISLTLGYFRFTSRKYGGHCTTFIFNTSTYTETSDSITESGYGTSSYVIFLITLTKSNSRNILDGFTKNVLRDRSVRTFHAPIAFHTIETNRLQIFCYFCPHDQFKTITDEASIIDILATATKLSKSGHGYTAQAFLPPVRAMQVLGYQLIWMYEYKCPYNNPLPDLIGCIKRVDIDVLVVKILLNYLNTSLSMVPFRGGLPRGKKESRWFLTIRQYEGFYKAETGITQTRGTMYIVKAPDLAAGVVCLNSTNLSSFQISMVNAINRNCWILLIFLSLLLTFVYQKFTAFLDLFVLLLGGSLDIDHFDGKKYVTIVCMLVLTLAYQSIISSESIEISEFPTARDVLQEGYKLTVNLPFEDEYNLIHPLVRFLAVYSDSLEQNDFPIRKHFTEVDVTTEAGWATVTKLVPFEYLRYVTERKLIHSALDARLDSLYQVLGKSIWVIGDDLICKQFDGRGESMMMPRTTSARHLEYLSTALADAWSHFDQAGISTKFSELKKGLGSKMAFDNYRMERLDDFKPVTGIPLLSAIGLFAVVVFCIGAAQLLALLLKVFFVMILRVGQNIFRTGVSLTTEFLWKVALGICTYKLQRTRVDKIDPNNFQFTYCP